MSDLNEQQRAGLDVRHEFELWKSNRGEAALYEGDGQYRAHGVTAQFDAFIAGVEAARRAPAAAPAPVAASEVLDDLRNVRQWMHDVVPIGTDFTIGKLAKMDKVIAALAAAPAAAPIVQPVADVLPLDVEFKRLADTILQATTNGTRIEALRSMAALFDRALATPASSTADAKDAAGHEQKPFCYYTDWHPAGRKWANEPHEFNDNYGTLTFSDVIKPEDYWHPLYDRPTATSAGGLFDADDLADACVACEVPSSVYESLCIALGTPAANGAEGRAA